MSNKHVYAEKKNGTLKQPVMAKHQIVLTSAIHSYDFHTICLGDVLHFFELHSRQQERPNVVTETVCVQLPRLVRT